MAFPPFLMKQLYRLDSVVISSFVIRGYTTREGEDDFQLAKPRIKPMVYSTGGKTFGLGDIL